ncbi:MAG: leucine-rich repeat domain-containing protein [Treponema sp.]|nr:leucine-rich repeat domain-containing protein [Treponema sp.]
MKKFNIILFYILLLTTKLFAQTSGQSGIWYYTLAKDGSKVEITGCSEQGANYVLTFPTYLEGVPVWCVNAKGEYKEIIIPEGVTDLGRFNVICQKVSIPSTVKKIPEKCFDQSRIKEFPIPNREIVLEGSLFFGAELPETIVVCKDWIYKPSRRKDIKGINTSIFSYYLTFAGSRGTKNVFFEEGIKEIPSAVFLSCEDVKNILFPMKSLKSIGSYAFAKTGIEVLSFSYDPQQIAPDEIKEGAFALCSNLTKIYWGTGVRTIGKDAFQECNKITAIDFPPVLRELGKDSFKNCQNLIAVAFYDIPESTGIKSLLESPELILKEGVFSNCSNLQKVFLNKNVTYIGQEAFLDCKKLTFIQIPDSIKQITFGGWQKLNDIHGTFHGTSLSLATQARIRELGYTKEF